MRLRLQASMTGKRAVLSAISYSRKALGGRGDEEVSFDYIEFKL